MPLSGLVVPSAHPAANHQDADQDRGEQEHPLVWHSLGQSPR
jgi:hypothetical protein